MYSYSITDKTHIYLSIHVQWTHKILLNLFEETLLSTGFSTKKPTVNQDTMQHFANWNDIQSLNNIRTDSNIHHTDQH